MLQAKPAGVIDGRIDNVGSFETRRETMGCFPCSFRNQARFERATERRTEAMQLLHESRTAGPSNPTHGFSNLPRIGASHLPAPESALPLPRPVSADFLKFDSDLSTWQNTGPALQRDDRQRAARQLRNAKRLHETSLTLQYLDLDDLPECLFAMSHLRELQVIYCCIGQIHALPPNLEKLHVTGAGLTHLPALPDSLHDLSLNHNRLTSLPQLPETLRDLSLVHNDFYALPALPTGLRQLSICWNQLTELPALPPGLRILNAGYNHLCTLPEIPATVVAMEVNNNRLTDLPASVYEMDRLEWVTVQANPIPLPVLERVRAGLARRTDDAVMLLDSEMYSGGRLRCFAVFRASSPEERLALPVPPLIAAVLAWYDRLPDSENMRHQRRAHWEAAYRCAPRDSGSHPSASFAGFLNRLCETAEFREPRLQPEFTARVCRLLDRLSNNTTLRTQCYALATDAMGECQDRIAVGLDHMEVSALSADATDGTLDATQIRALGMGMLKLSELQTICAEFIKRYPYIDAIELHLALRIRFAAALDLPVATQRMHYEPPSEVTEPDWTAAYKRVSATASDPEREIAFLAQWKPWQAHLDRQALPQLKAAQEEKIRQAQFLQAELDAVMDQLMESATAPEIYSEAYFDLHADIARINLAFTQLEAALIDPVRLACTRAMLTAAGEPVQDSKNDSASVQT